MTAGCYLSTGPKQVLIDTYELEILIVNERIKNVGVC